MSRSWNTRKPITFPPGPLFHITVTNFGLGWNSKMDLGYFCVILERANGRASQEASCIVN
uniref:Uncharacterized protein n=1 Tax=Anguilla anguilla TaxID=7936 RepID=A0A0E9XEZ9_ANGAN